MVPEILRRLGLASCLIASGACWCLGQTSTSSLSQGIPGLPATALPTFSDNGSPAGGGSSANAVVSDVTNTSASGFLGTVNPQINAALEQTAQGGRRSTNGLIAGQSSFGAPSTVVNAGQTEMGVSEQAVFGISRTYANAEMTAVGGTAPSSASASVDHDAGSPRAAGARQTSLSSSTSSPSVEHAVSSAGESTPEGGKFATSTSAVAKPSETAADTRGGRPGQNAASYSESFPDSTQGTALLSPPDLNASPFAGLPDGLQFPLPNISSGGFLRLSLKTGAGGKETNKSEDPYQRFLDRIHSQSSSSSSRGLSNGLSQPSSSSFSSRTGNRSGYDSGLKPSTGLETGLQNTNPYMNHPF